MPVLNAEINLWIRQMADPDQQVAYFAYQCLQEEVFRASAPDNAAGQAALATALGEALCAQAKAGEGASSRGQASFRFNPFLTAAAGQQAAEPLHPGRVRAGLARLLGYLPCEEAAAALEKAIGDLEAREAVRQSLESNPTGRATAGLLAALDTDDPEFKAGVINSLGKRGGDRVAAALQTAAADPMPEVRAAALLALADLADPAHDALFDKVSRSANPGDRRAAYLARTRLAGSLQRDGRTAAAVKIARAIIAGNAPEAQKKAARRIVEKSVAG